MIKKLFNFLFIGLLISTRSSAQPVPPMREQRPNIIVFLVDDMGWQDCSVPFWSKVTELNKRYHTPNMERLASEGIEQPVKVMVHK